MKTALIDCDDSFTWNIYDYLCQCGFQVNVIGHAEVNVAELRDYEAIVLSPGPNAPSDIPILFDIIDRYKAVKHILGICLGHQAIGLYFGHQIIHSKCARHGVPVKIVCDKNPIFANIDIQSVFVMRYNSLALDDFEDSELKVIARDEMGEIMAFEHTTYSLYSFQFHPESVGTVHGLQLFRNWRETIWVGNS